MKNRVQLFELKKITFIQFMAIQFMAIISSIIYGDNLLFGVIFLLLD